MDQNEYQFSQESVNRIVQAVLTIEAIGLPGGQQRRTQVTSENIRWVGKTTESITKGQSGVVQVYSGDPGLESEITDFEIDAYSRFGDLDEDKWVFIEFINGGWEIYQGEC
jgi:hypothetical protein